MRKWNFEFNIHVYWKQEDSPGQYIYVDIDKQERNPPNLGPQVPANVKSTEQTSEKDISEQLNSFNTTQILKKKSYSF